MTLQLQPRQTFPDQPAANSGGAVGFVLGTLVGGLVAAAVPFFPAIETLMTSRQAFFASYMGGTLSGAVVGFVRDLMSRPR